MKSKPLFIAIFSLLLLSFLAFSAAIFFLEKNRAPKSPSPSELPDNTSSFEQTPLLSAEPQSFEGTFFLNQEGEGTVPASPEAVEVSLRGAKEGKTVALSWDESKVRVFHVVLLNAELRAIWLLSSLGTLPENEQGITIKRKDVSLFIPSGYVAGDRVEGFQMLDEQQAFELTLGQQYYLQMLGFTKDDQSIAVNKKFTFTDSCFPPNCE